MMHVGHRARRVPLGERRERRAARRPAPATYFECGFRSKCWSCSACIELVGERGVGFSPSRSAAMYIVPSVGS